MIIATTNPMVERRAAELGIKRVLKCLRCCSAQSAKSWSRPIPLHTETLSESEIELLKQTVVRGGPSPMMLRMAVAATHSVTTLAT